MASVVIITVWAISHAAIKHSKKSKAARLAAAAHSCDEYNCEECNKSSEKFEQNEHYHPSEPFYTTPEPSMPHSKSKKFRQAERLPSQQVRLSI
jgi:hypothetical protein